LPFKKRDDLAWFMLLAGDDRKAVLKPAWKRALRVEGPAFPKNIPHEMKGVPDMARKIFVLFLMILLLGGLDYATSIHRSAFDLAYRELYLLPVFLGAWWFGRKGGLATSLIVSMVYLPCAILAQTFGVAFYVGNLVEVIVFNAVGAIFGTMRDLERRREKEKLEAVMAMAGCVGHELNNPLAIAMQAARLIQEEMGPESEYQGDLQTIVRNLRRMRDLIKKITGIKRVELTHYAANCHIVDLEKSSAA